MEMSICPVWPLPDVPWFNGNVPELWLLTTNHFFHEHAVIGSSHFSPVRYHLQCTLFTSTLSSPVHTFHQHAIIFSAHFSPARYHLQGTLFTSTLSSSVHTFHQHAIISSAHFSPDWYQTPIHSIIIRRKSFGSLWFVMRPNQNQRLKFPSNVRIYTVYNKERYIYIYATLQDRRNTIKLLSRSYLLEIFYLPTS